MLFVKKNKLFISFIHIFNRLEKTETKKEKKEKIRCFLFLKRGHQLSDPWTKY